MILIFCSPHAKFLPLLKTSGISTVAVRGLAMAEARVRFSYTAPLLKNFLPKRTWSSLTPFIDMVMLLFAKPSSDKQVQVFVSDIKAKTSCFHK